MKPLHLLLIWLTLLVFSAVLENAFRQDWDVWIVANAWSGCALFLVFMLSARSKGG